MCTHTCAFVCLVMFLSRSHRCARVHVDMHGVQAISLAGARVRIPVCACLRVGCTLVSVLWVCVCVLGAVRP